MSNLNHTQDILLEMLKKLHNMCEQNNIRYYAIGGTMLGIARHQGFIPWDDDIDVGMPRTDYERFLQLFENRTFDHYSVESAHSQDPAFTYPYAKLYDTSTTLIENRRIPLKRGLYIDIFPLDGIGDSMKKSRRTYSKIKRKNNLLVLRSLAYSRDRNFYKKAIIFLAQILPNRIAGEKKLTRSIEALCKERDFDSSEYVGNAVGAWGWKEIMPRYIFGTPTQYVFENITVMGVEKADEYLTHIYSDWRKEPPKDKRVSHHSYQVDLTRSYIDS